VEPSAELQAELAQVQKVHDEVTAKLVAVAQSRADARTREREIRYAELQAEIEALPYGPHREALQATLDTARLRDWEGDDWQTEIRHRMSGQG